MLAGDWVPADPQQIDFDALPRLPSEHASVSDVVATGGVNQHNYLAYHGGRFWVMWSDGPGVEDRVGQRVKLATSRDGSSWSAWFSISATAWSAPSSSWQRRPGRRGWS